MPDTELRARTAFEVIDASIRVLRAHYGSFILIGALASFPTWATMWFLGWFTLATNPASVDRLVTQPLFGFGGVVALLVTYIWWAIADCATVVAASDAYLGRDVVPARAISAALRRGPALVGARILKAFALALGYLLLFVGMFYMAARYFAVVPALLLEDAGAVDSFHRSRDLAKNFKWHIFGGLLVAWVIYFVVYVVLFMVASAFSALVPSPAVSALVFVGVSALVYPILGIVTTLLYYDQRIRKEGFDLEIMAKDLVPVAG